MVSSADVIIVLGGGVHDDGSLPTRARARVRKGVSLYHQGKAQKLLMSGSHSGHLGQMPQVTEARAMKKYAIFLGVPSRAILIEEKSKDTIGNAYFSKVNVLQRYKKWKSVIVVSSKDHFPRARIIFEHTLGPKYTIECVSSNPYALHHHLACFLGLMRNDVLLVETETFFLGIQKGDDKSIQERMIAVHPYYSREDFD